MYQIPLFYHKMYAKIVSTVRWLDMYIVQQLQLMKQNLMINIFGFGVKGI